MILKRWAVVGVLGCLVVHAALADQGEIERRESEVRDAERKDTKIQKKAQRWDLEVEEWKRYKSLMEGPRGTWSPNLSPVWVLGINARDKEERRRYAEKALQQEHERVRKELAFQRAYDRASERLFPNEPMIDLGRLEGEQRSRTGSKRVGAGSRLMVVTRIEGCTRCEDVVARVLEFSRENEIGVDFYVTGTEQGDDGAIRRWADSYEIDPSAVRSKRVTLNHGRGIADRIGVKGRLPALIHRTSEGVHREISLSELR